MTLVRNGKWWRGDDFEDLGAYVRRFQAGGYPVYARRRGRVIRGGCGADPAERRT